MTTDPREKLLREQLQLAMKEKFSWNALHVLDNRSQYSDQVYQHVFYAWQGFQAGQQSADDVRRDAEISIHFKYFIDAVENLAFKMPAPNKYTPQFAMYCVDARAMLNAAKAAIAEGRK